MHIVLPLKDRFWHKVDKSNEDGCWTWMGNKNQRGYGMLWISDAPAVKRLAHRISWELHNGAIPHGLGVLHKCDNPPCVNPAHLFIGTFRENMKDKVAKERHARGIKTPNHILTDDQVREIRKRYELRDKRARRNYLGDQDKNGARSLAGEYGVSQWTIFDVVSRRRWKHVE